MPHEEDKQVTPGDEEKEVRQTDDEVAQEEEEAVVVGFASSGSSSVYLRGPASLPQRPIPPHRCPLIRANGEK
jgi:hypothetical protein